MPATQPTPLRERGEDSLAGFEHPRGTLAIVIGMAVLFAVGWFGMYVFMFLKRGAIH